MSDLIDLSSPEEKRIRSELPLPLIPPPENDPPKPVSLNLSDTRRSLDNNPFDTVLRKTSEYVSKLSDPFEIVFERATSKRPSDPLKLNKTLDDAQLHSMSQRDAKAPDLKEDVPSILVEPPSPGRNLSILDQSAMNDSFRTFSDCLSMSKNFPSLCEVSATLEKSILNNSAMNDTLSTSEGSSDDCFLKSLIAERVSMCIRKGTLDAELLDTDKSSKNPKMRRSFSQGDRLSPRKFRKRSTSIINDRKNSDHSVPSILYEDPLNLGFMSRDRSEYSSVSDYSEFSNITRLNSVNSGSLFSWKSSNDSANRGFVESSGVRGSRSSEGNFSDLISRFKSLRMKSSGGEETVGAREASGGLADEDVFLEDEPTKKSSIFSQANILARTFEELAEKSTRGSSSSGENLFSTRLPSNFELSSETSVTCPTINDISICPKKTESPPQIPSTNSSATPKISSEAKKEAAANLLRNLESVVKTEQNPEIMKLLRNLEEALGVKIENNSEMLYEPSNPSTNEAKSPSKIPISSPKAVKQVSPREEPNKSSDKNKKQNESPPGDSHNCSASKSHPTEAKKIPTTGENSQKNQQNDSKSNSSGTIGSAEDPEERDKSASTSQESEKSSEDNTEPGHSLFTTAENLNVYTSINKSTSKVIHSGTESTQHSFATQKLILDIQLAVGKLLEDCKDEPALVLENLNRVLTSNPEKHPVSPRKSGLPYRSLKSLGHQLPESQKTSQKSSSRPSPLRRRSSVSQASEKSRNAEFKSPESPKKCGKRRNTSDPGFVDVSVEKKQVNVSMKIKSTLPVGDKAKLKKKSDSVGTRRGPMKALAPVGSMQRSGMGALPPGTPPKKHKAPSPMKIATSTPDPSPIVLGKKPTKATKPVASSTPDLGGKDKSSRSHIPQSPKKGMNWNISPVTPNAKGNASGMFVETDVPQTPKTIDSSSKARCSLIGGLNRVKEKIIRGRRSEPVQISPRNERRASKTTASPLKEKNVIKVKPLNLTAKFRGRSGSLGNMEKENKFLSPKV